MFLSRGDAMRTQSLKTTSCLLLGIVLVGCARVPIPIADAPEQLTLYSIDGRDDIPARRPKTAESFLGYHVLGKVDVTDAEQRKQIMRAVRLGIARSDGRVAKCFWPRHALRAVSNGTTFDYVICFECYQIQHHLDGQFKTAPTTRQPQAVLNKHLTEAGVPVVPEAF
jgi:hypothetical protein